MYVRGTQTLKTSTWQLQGYFRDVAWVAVPRALFPSALSFDLRWSLLFAAIGCDSMIVIDQGGMVYVRKGMFAEAWNCGSDIGRFVIIDTSTMIVMDLEPQPRNNNGMSLRTYNLATPSGCVPILNARRPSSLPERNEKWLPKMQSSTSMNLVFAI